GSYTNMVQSFDSDGWTMGDSDNINTNNETYVAWNWKAGGAASSNTDGTITSSVSANTDAGFSIVSYTGNGTDNATIGHGLSAAPELVIVKNRSSVYSWSVNGSVGGLVFGTNVLQLDTTHALITTATQVKSSTSTILTLGTGSLVNKTTADQDYIAYCFHSVDGYSKLGSYTGNGSTDGSFIYTGFRPAFVMWKRTDSADNWTIEDDARNSYNGVNWTLEADTNMAEWNDANFRYDFLSNGFKQRNSFVQNNASGGSYIYLAFAESPFKYSNAR
ncbi:MAG: hypothetical protein QF535_24070, partial [Anaerolineales bacterium]|nr:hypothetical protein [Anaerolineales bacterium]